MTVELLRSQARLGVQRIVSQVLHPQSVIVEDLCKWSFEFPERLPAWIGLVHVPISKHHREYNHGGQRGDGKMSN